MRFSNVLNLGHTNSTFTVTEVENHKTVESGIIATEEESNGVVGICVDERSSYTQVDPDHQVPTRPCSSSSSNNEHVNVSVSTISVNSETDATTGSHLYHSSSNGNSHSNGAARLCEDLPPLYKRLIHEAPYISAKKLEVDQTILQQANLKSTKEEKTSIEVKVKPNFPIGWADPELIAEGKAFIRRNFFSIIFAHMVALAFLLVIKPIQSLLLRTGAIHNKETSLKRYLLTILHIKRWYESDFLEESSKATEDIISVRKLYEKAARDFKFFIPPPAQELQLCQDEQELLEALKDDLRVLVVNVDERRDLEKIYTTVNPDVPMSQYDLAVIQFAFFGFVACFPKVFGIHESQKKNAKAMQGFIHIWAVLGRLLGLEDQYNLCLNENFDEKTNEKIFKEIFLFSFKFADSTGVRLWKAMTAGSYRYFFFFRTKSLLLFMTKNVARVEQCPKLCDIMNWAEKFCYFCYSFTMKWELRLFLIRWSLNSFSRTVFYFGNKVYLKKSREKDTKGTFADLSIYGNNDDGGTPLSVIIEEKK